MLKDVSDKSIKEEGERMVPAFHKGALVYGEHLIRYESIQPLVKNKVVLDIASGSGYGTYILAQDAKRVIGVEIDPDSLEYSNKNYVRKNIEFKLGSAEAIPLEDGSVEVVVSFETIEHLKDHRKFLSEVKRVLKPGGVAIISTPNDREFPEHNKFHLHEFEYEELKGLIKHYFKHVEILYQASWYYSALFKSGEAGKPWQQQLVTNNFAPLADNEALYFLSICSDTSLAKLPQPIAMGALSEKFSPRQQEKLQTEVLRAQELDAKIMEKHQELQAVYHSRGWRFLQKFYKIEGLILGLFR